MLRLARLPLARSFGRLSAQAVCLAFVAGASAAETASKQVGFEPRPVPAARGSLPRFVPGPHPASDTLRLVGSWEIIPPTAAVMPVVYVPGSPETPSAGTIEAPGDDSPVNATPAEGTTSEAFDPTTCPEDSRRRFEVVRTNGAMQIGFGTPEVRDARGNPTLRIGFDTVTGGLLPIKLDLALEADFASPAPRPACRVEGCPVEQAAAGCCAEGCPLQSAMKWLGWDAPAKCGEGACREEEAFSHELILFAVESEAHTEVAVPKPCAKGEAWRPAVVEPCPAEGCRTRPVAGACLGGACPATAKRAQTPACPADAFAAEAGEEPSDAAKTVLELMSKFGSVVDDSELFGRPSAEVPPQIERREALIRVIHDLEAKESHPEPAPIREPVVDALPLPAGDEDVPTPEEMSRWVDSLRRSADDLDETAQDLEHVNLYEQADSIRESARRMREDARGLASTLRRRQQDHRTTNRAARLPGVPELSSVPSDPYRRSWKVKEAMPSAPEASSVPSAPSSY